MVRKSLKLTIRRENKMVKSGEDCVEFNDVIMGSQPICELQDQDPCEALVSKESIEVKEQNDSDIPQSKDPLLVSKQESKVEGNVVTENEQETKQCSKSIEQEKKQFLKCSEQQDESSNYSEEDDETDNPLFEFEGEGGDLKISIRDKVSAYEYLHLSIDLTKFGADLIKSIGDSFEGMSTSNVIRLGRCLDSSADVARLLQSLANASVSFAKKRRIY